MVPFPPRRTSTHHLHAYNTHSRARRMLTHTHTPILCTRLPQMARFPVIIDSAPSARSWRQVSSPYRRGNGQCCRNRSISPRTRDRRRLQPRRLGSSKRIRAVSRPTARAAMQRACLRLWATNHRVSGRSLQGRHGRTGWRLPCRRSQPPSCRSDRRRLLRLCQQPAMRAQ